MSANRMIATIFLSAFATVILIIVVAILSMDDGMADLPVATEIVANAGGKPAGSDR